MEDTAANLATDAATNSGEGTFTQDKASPSLMRHLSQLTNQRSQRDKTLTYTTVEDTAANLATDAATNSGEGTFTKDKAVTLTDEASIAELTAINAPKAIRHSLHHGGRHRCQPGNRCRHQQW